MSCYYGADLLCTGRPRPCFFEQCGYDNIKNECTLDDLGARSSWPSGHSSCAFAGMLFLSLWLYYRIKDALPSSSPHHMNIGVMMMTSAPTMLAGWIAISRTQDYRYVL